MNYKKCSVEHFMQAWFDRDYSFLSKEDFKIVHAEYLDTSGLFMCEDFEKRGYITHLSERINYIKLFLRLQRDFISEFNMPFIRDFEDLKDKYGYSLKWNNDLEGFEKQLKKIEKREEKNSSYLEIAISELETLRSLNQKKELTEDETEEELIKSRLSFIRMINSLNKIGYKIDEPITTVEKLSLMIKQEMDDSKELSSKSSYGR